MGKELSAQKSTYRLQFKFWLDALRDQENTLADYLESLKQSRAFSSTIRDAVRLIRDLRQESLSVLFELFPWVNSWLEERAQVIAEGMLRSREDGQSGRGEGTDVKALQASIERLEMALLQQHSREAIQAARLGDDRAPRLLPPPVSSRITSELPDIAIASAIPEKGKVYANYMRSLTSFSSKQVRQSSKKLSISEPPIGDQDVRQIAPVAGGKPRLIQGANVQFAAPHMDDLSVDF